MNKTREERLLEGQQTNAQHVYECIPMKDAWTVNQVIQEYARVHGKPVEKRIILACLGSLARSGLARQPKSGLWQRACTKKPVADKPAEPIEDKPVEKEHPKIVVNNTQKKKPDDMAERMTRAIERMNGIVSMAKDLADDLEVMMIDLQEKIDEAKDKAERFDRLQKLLKD